MISQIYQKIFDISKFLIHIFFNLAEIENQHHIL